MRTPAHTALFAAVVGAATLLVALGGPSDAGPSGRRIPRATTSLAGPAAAAVRGYTFVTGSSQVPAHRQGNAVATCPSGTVVVGGGGTFDGPAGGFLNTSRPVNGSTSWQLFGNNTADSPSTLDVTAICAANVRSYQIVMGEADDNAPHEQDETSATCPSGTVAFGGGALASSTSVRVNLASSVPVSSGWFVVVDNNSATAETVTPIAVCGARPAGYAYASTSGTPVAPGAYGTDTVACPGGTRPLSGGGISTGTTRKVSLGAIDPIDGYTGWIAGITNGSAQQSTITAYAVCAQTTPG